MTFDQSTRNRLQRFVSDARCVLETEFTRQLQNDFGLDPSSGEITPLENLRHLTDAQRETSRILRATLTHYCTEPSTSARTGLDRIVREQAFTILNRLAALRMAEARGLIIESVSNGYQAKGFQLFMRLAGPSLGEMGDAYRIYLSSIFDDFSMDLPTLFNRYSQHGRLFPREVALLEIIALMCDEDIAQLWSEDETIGWIYQFFNSKEERKKMRDESAAPRDSRELAVRNQFFTPRYVVEFLTDNSLGRLWYEMTKGNTKIPEYCHYLIIRPEERFLRSGESIPAKSNQDTLNQTALLQQPVNMRNISLKDPREIKLLDPACGSMHFGLYAFDLFLLIYQEAWEISKSCNPSYEEVKKSSSFKLFSEWVDSFRSHREYIEQIPKLIIEHNINGIDIDPRAVQIAGLSLWLRAQRSWHELGVSNNNRPAIQKSNIVCAEPMPGERELLEEFLNEGQTDNTEDSIVSRLIPRIFDHMKLAGIAGSLLKIEEEIAVIIREAKIKWGTNKPIASGWLFDDESYNSGQDIKDNSIQTIKDKTFWAQLENRIYLKLKDYSEHMEGNNVFQRRLFANDTALGFAFIDLCRQKYDIILMNPPFGSCVPTSEECANTPSYKNSISKNLAWGFFERAKSLSYESGGSFIGAIVDRTIFQKSSYADFRLSIIDDMHICEYLDLGIGVLDDANVMTSACICETIYCDNPTVFIDARKYTQENKPGIILDSIRSIFENKCLPIVYYRYVDELKNIPFCSFSYWMSNQAILSIFKQCNVGELGYNVGGGLQCNDVFRFVRILPELPLGPPRSKWVPFYNGGPFSGYWLQNYQYIQWDENGRDIKSKIIYEMGDHPSRYVANEQMYFSMGIAGGKRGEFFDVHIFPSGMIFSNEGRCFQSSNLDDVYFILGYLNHPIPQNLVNAFCGQHKGSDYLRKIPIPELLLSRKNEIGNLALELACIKRRWSTLDEFGLEFVTPFYSVDGISNLDISTCWKDTVKHLESDNIIYSAIEKKLDDIIVESIGAEIAIDLMSWGWTESPRPTDSIEAGVPYLKYFGIRDFAVSVLMYLVGVAFGRWDVRYTTGDLDSPELPNLFMNPSCFPPAQLDDNSREFTEVRVYPIKIPIEGILVDDPGHPFDFETAVCRAMEVIWKDRWQMVEHEIQEILGVSSIREYLSKPIAFFNDHLRRYSRSRRQAPVYWPLTSPSGRYTIWVYCHKCNEQTLYACINDFVKPKLKKVREDLQFLKQIGPQRSRDDEKQFAELQELEQDLDVFLGNLIRLTDLPWKPDLGDGIEITAAPLWNLFLHKPWQKTLHETWKSLNNGEYDWSKLSFEIWPERIRDKCRCDKSLAINHGLDSLFEGADIKTKKRGRKKQEGDE
jgi:hypothetical protein